MPLTLARLGVGAFHLADFDTFDIANFNRQVGAMHVDPGKPKVEVIADMVRDINPEADIKIFPQGIDAANLPAFLDGVDLYVDGLDFFVFDIRQQTFAAVRRAAAFPRPRWRRSGMGAARAELPAGPDDVRRIFPVGRPAAKTKRRSASWSGWRRPACTAPTWSIRRRSILPSGAGPRPSWRCQLCAGIAATQALKILLKRGKVLAAPHGMQFDAYRNKHGPHLAPGRQQNPLQRLAIASRQAPP